MKYVLVFSLCLLACGCEHGLSSNRAYVISQSPVDPEHIETPSEPDAH